MKEEKIKGQPWHSIDVDAAIDNLHSDSNNGLTQAQAAKRLEEYGRNKLPYEKKQKWWQRLLRQFKNMLIYILIVAAILAMILGKWIDASVIIAVVLINAAIGFIQEGKAHRAMESIRGMLSPRAKVIRDSQQREIAAEELVPGDMVVIDSGDRVPADIRILEARNALVDEANLTGESEPVTKQENPVQDDTPLNDRNNMAYSSTMLTSGNLKGIVVDTGKNSEIGRIGEMVSGIKEISTPLLRKIDDFGKNYLWLSFCSVLRCFYSVIS